MDNKLIEKPMVSIHMLAYNHEKYIRQALDGILMQKVDFTYEIVVGEDCSTDNTRAILLEYKEKYPDRIKLILHEKNVGYLENDIEVLRQCKGKYIAQCEGDDYWVEPYKLKKQVEFLENNPDYIGTAHIMQVVDEYGHKYGINQKCYCNDEIYTINQFENGFLPGHTATLVFRNILADNSSAMNEMKNCKTNALERIVFFLVLHGKFYCFQEVMSHYRLVTDHGDSWSARTKGENLCLFYFNSYRELSLLAKRIKKAEPNFAKMYLECGLWAFTAMVGKPNRKNIGIFKSIHQTYNNKTEANLYILKNFSKKLFIFPFRKISLLFT